VISDAVRLPVDVIRMEDAPESLRAGVHSNGVELGRDG
jgi:hypothetical protein